MAKVQTDLIFNIYQVTALNSAWLGQWWSKFNGGEAAHLAIGSNIIFASDGLFQAADADPSNFVGAGLNYVFANDIENIIGGQGGTEFRFHDGAHLQGVISTGIGGKVTLDYSEFGSASGIQADLGAGFGGNDVTLISGGDVPGLDGTILADGGLVIPSVRLVYGNAPGVDGNRFGGFEDLLRAIPGVSLPGGIDPKNYAVNEAGKITGTSHDDTLRGNSLANTFVVGGGMDQIDGGPNPTGLVVEPPDDTVSYEDQTGPVTVDLAGQRSWIGAPSYLLSNVHGLALPLVFGGFTTADIDLTENVSANIKTALEALPNRPTVEVSAASAPDGTRTRSSSPRSARRPG